MRHAAAARHPLCRRGAIPGIGLGCLVWATALPLAAGTFTTRGSALLDPCGEVLVLRGVNAGIAFPTDNSASQLPEVAKSGANAVRLTFRWIINHSDPAQVDTALQAAAANQLLAIPAVWDATGVWSRLPFTVDYWSQPAMVAVLRKHEDRLLLNIANEAGDAAVTNEQFRDGYAGAVRRLREAGLHMPLVIDAANWGRWEAYLLDNGPYLIDQDPDHKLLFSWHPWDTGQPASRYQSAFASAAALGMPLIVGEFSSVGADGTGTVDYAALMQLAAESGIGWLWWWWWSGAGVDAHSMTTDGGFGNWANVGEEVALTSPYGINATAATTHYLQHGACAARQARLPPPRRPKGLQAQTVQGTEVQLTWEDNSISERNFDIEAWDEAAQGWRLIKVVAANTTATSVGGDLAFVYTMDADKDPSLRYGTGYAFRVGAYRSRDALSYSEPVSVVTGPNPGHCLAGVGLQGEYYQADHQSQNFDDYEHPNMVRIDPGIQFDWGSDSPNATNMASDHFQIRWTGAVVPQFDGTYTFYTYGDDFTRVWVDDVPIIDNWRANAFGWAQGRIDLTAGKKHSIRVEYREWTGKAKVELYWAHSRLARELVPACRLVPN